MRSQTFSDCLKKEKCEQDDVMQIERTLWSLPRFYAIFLLTYFNIYVNFFHVPGSYEVF